ncbi:calmodulin-binding protein 60 D-like isoform X3 [Miscanthus floridulus]|uniref:calmodulin-binding protein 60 D-like isoform X3 n=1 Tax=Miscanthus floridulus TaxID=154761 RepID=UPI00345988B8
MINGVFFTFAANKKIVIPKLDDEVHGLKGIKRNGDYADRLKKAGINTVQKFLKAFNEDPEKLRRQILNIYSENNKSWRAMVEHARECDLRNNRRLKSCPLQVQKREVTLFFNVVHDLVGAEFSGRFVAKGKFTEEEEVVVDGLLKQAYQQLNDTFDHIMKDNRPVNIHASINAAGSRSVPISGIDCADGPLPGTAGQSAPEPSRSDHRNKIANQGVGQNHIPIGDHDGDAGTFSVSDVPVVEVVNGTDRVYMLDLDQQGHILALFACLMIRTFQLIFSARTVFFSHNKSVGTVLQLVLYVALTHIR